MAKRAIAPLLDGRVRLRLLEEGDLPQTLAWRNRDDVRRWFLHSEVITPEQHRQWFAAYRDADDDFVFVIEEVRDLGKPVGQVSLYRIDWTSRRAEYGRLMIGEADARGRGLAQAATALLVQYAVAVLGLRHIDLEVFADNRPALAVYEACGFRPRERSGALLRMVWAG